MKLFLTKNAKQKQFVAELEHGSWFGATQKYGKMPVKSILNELGIRRM